MTPPPAPDPGAPPLVESAAPVAAPLENASDGYATDARVAGPARSEHTGLAGVVVTSVGPESGDAAVRMHARCSVRTLRQRYHGPPERAAEYLSHLLRPQHGRSVAAWSPAGTMVGLGHLLWDGDDTEMSLLVEDAWQHRGVGGALLARLIGLARRAGRHEVYVVTRASNRGMLRTMRATGLPLRYDRSAGTLVVSASLVSEAPDPAFPSSWETPYPTPPAGFRP